MKSQGFIPLPCVENVGHILLRDGKHGNLELSEISNYAPDADDYYWAEVCQWGDIAWRLMGYMFVRACEIPDRFGNTNCAMPRAVCG